MSAFKRFISELLCEDSEEESSQCSAKPKIANLKQQSSSSLASQSSAGSACSNCSSHERIAADVVYERENVLGLYNKSKGKPDSVEEMGKKFKRYISSK